MAFPLIPPEIQFFDSSGSPLVGGTVTFRDPSTNNLIDTYPTADDADAGTNANANPLTLNARGAAADGIYLPDGTVYRVILADAEGNNIWTEDDVLAPRRGELLAAEETAAGVTPTDMAYPVGNARRYGAVGDGATDDSTAITNWLSVGQQGIPLTIDHGTYVCSTWTQFSVSSDLYIKSNGDAIIQGTASDDFLRANGGGIDIEGVGFNQWNHVIQNDTADSGTTAFLNVRYCRFTNVNLYCIYIERAIDRFNISDNRFETISTGCVLIGTDTYANQDTWRRGIVSRNHAKDINNSGAGNAHFLLFLGRDCIASDNYIENVTSNTGEAWGIYFKSRYGSIHGNVIRSVQSTSSNSIGINVKGDDRSTTTGTQGFATTVHGNTLIGPAATSGNVLAIQLACEDVQAYNNYMEGWILGVVTTGGGDNISINDNTFIGVNTSAGTYGINANHYGDNFLVSGNNIDTCDNAVRVADNGTGDVTNWSFTGNTAYNCGTSAFEVLTSSQAINNLSITDNNVDTATSFLNVGNVNGLSVTGNQWSNLSGGNETIFTVTLPNPQNIYVADNGPFEVQTTDGTITSIARWDFPDNTAVMAEYEVIGMESDGSDRALYRDGGLFYVDGGNLTQQGSTYNLATAIESDATWGGASFVVSGDGLFLRVTGVASQTINWKCTYKISSIN